MATPRSRRALLIATNTYSDPGLAALRAPAGDVEALAAVLADSSIGGFEVSRLVDRPTDELKREIEAFFRAAGPDELLLLYFSCHGVLSQSRQLYFATSSTALQWLRATAIEDSFVNHAMQHSRARSIVLILDCSYGGAGLPVDVERRFAGRGRVTLSVSTELEYAYEEPELSYMPPPGSPFTRRLVEGLASGRADIDGDGNVSVDELFHYLLRHMRGDAAGQVPRIAGDVSGDIVMAHSGPVIAPQAVATTAEPPEAAPRHRGWLRLRTPRRPRPRPEPSPLAELELELARVRADAAIEPVAGPQGAAEDVVDCTVFAPPRVQPSQTVLVQAFAHLLEQTREVTALAQRFDHAAQARAVRSLAAPIPRGSRLTFELRMPAAKVEDPVQTLVWRGRPESVQFAVAVPRAARGACVGTVVVRRDMWPVGHVKFKLDVEPAAGRSRPMPVGDQARRYARAFLSYASADRPKVIDRVQMLRLLQVDYFQDLLTLEPGERWEQRLFEEIERSDLFILFWSRQARASKWVRKETRHALAHRAGAEFGAPEICPVIVEGPPVARPWRELADLHFNDSLLYLKAGHP